MALYRVYHEQINQDFMLVSASSDVQAVEIAARKMKKIYPSPSTVENVETGKSQDCSEW